MDKNDITEALYEVLDNYQYDITFTPGLKTLIKITGAAVVGNIIGLYAMKYMAVALNKLADRVEWENIKLDYKMTQGENHE